MHPVPVPSWDLNAERYGYGGQAQDSGIAAGDNGGDMYLDAVGKGKGKNGGRGKRPLVCHNCLGRDHMFRYCTSAYGAKDNPSAIVCEGCGGRGHNKAQCPSPGGGRYNPECASKGDKGKGGKAAEKGKGKDGNKGGKGYSQYFKGKGSGVSSMDQWSQWSQCSVLTF